MTRDHIERRWAVSCQYSDGGGPFLAGCYLDPERRKRTDLEAAAPTITTYRTRADARKVAGRIRSTGLTATAVCVRVRIEVLS